MLKSYLAEASTTEEGDRVTQPTDMSQPLSLATLVLACGHSGHEGRDGGPVPLQG